jgi:hypothetical protein
MLVRPNDRGVDHLDTVLPRAALIQGFEQDMRAFLPALLSGMRFQGAPVVSRLLRALQIIGNTRSRRL